MRTQYEHHGKLNHEVSALVKATKNNDFEKCFREKKLNPAHSNDSTGISFTSLAKVYRK